ncbi:MAG: hypothetical protein HYW57_09250 [Ignavibacteriales bacterium]|nr:hypothetical protein [Ignavibacteriales bacterium]
MTSQVDASPPGCFACHSPHSNGDFALRSVSPVTQLSPLSGVTNPIFDYGKGNQCVACHQPRSLSPQMPNTAPASTDTLRITNSRWYAHYGVQGLMLMGEGGYKFPGYTYTGNSPHAASTLLKQEGCIACHMAPSNAGSGIGGGHTMNVNYLNTSGNPTWNTNGCLVSGCHSSMASVDDYVSTSASLTGGMGAHKYVHQYLDTLKNLLVSNLLLHPTSGLVMGGNGTSTASSSNPKIFVGSQILKAGALYNYFFLEHDLGGGAHNSKYAIELLQSSIEEMKKP